MESFNEQFFSSEFILNYIGAEEGKKRFLTYITFRFLSFAEETHKELPALLKEKLGRTYTASDFSVVEDFLASLTTILRRPSKPVLSMRSCSMTQSV